MAPPRAPPAAPLCVAGSAVWIRRGGGAAPAPLAPRSGGGAAAEWAPATVVSVDGPTNTVLARTEDGEDVRVSPSDVELRGNDDGVQVRLAGLKGQSGTCAQKRAAARRCAQPRTRTVSARAPRRAGGRQGAGGVRSRALLCLEAAAGGRARPRQSLDWRTGLDRPPDREANPRAAPTLRPGVTRSGASARALAAGAAPHTGPIGRDRRNAPAGPRGRRPARPPRGLAAKFSPPPPTHA